MKTPTRLATVAISALSLFLAACGGGGGLASGGIGGSGIQVASIGPVSATGSVTVNGVRYETTAAIIRDDDGDQLLESDLRKGLMVEVDGQVDDTGTGGTASLVTVLFAVQGPVEQLQLTADPLTGIPAGQMTVMGQPVAVDDQTQFEESLSGLNGLAPGDLVAVSGLVDPQGAIRALHIEKKPTLAVFKLRGFVDTVSGAAMTINGLTIAFSGPELTGFNTTGPQAGDFISAQGTALAAGTLTAQRVENENRALADEEHAEIEGFITTVSGSQFRLVSGAGTFVFQTTAATQFEGGGAGDLGTGLKVEVEGPFTGGVLIAGKVSIKDGIRVEATIDSVFQRRITLVNLSTLELIINDQTEIKDERGGATNRTPSVDQLLPTLTPGRTTFQVRARVSGSGSLSNATELVITKLEVASVLSPSNAVKLRGPLDAPPDPGSGNFTILGVTIFSDNATRFLAEDNTPIAGPDPRQTFLNQVFTGSSVRASGTTAQDNVIAATQLEVED